MRKKIYSILALLCLTVTSAWAQSVTTLADATAADVGKVVCAAGHLHTAKTAVPTGCTAVGILGKVTETGQGLILALQNATSQNWNTINGWTSETTYAGTTLKVLPDDAARGSLTSYTTLGETTVSNWAVAQKSDYEAIFTNLGSTKGDSDGITYDANVNAYITTGVGGTAISGYYWSATEYNGSNAWYFLSAYWSNASKTSSLSVRPVLGFNAPAASTYTVTFKEGTEDVGNWTITPAEATTTGVAAGTEVKATYGGTKKVKSVKAKKKAAAPAELGHALADAVVGEIVGTDGKAYAVADKDNLPTDVTAAGMVAYKNGSNGLVIALTDEASEMNWSTANGATTGAAAHTPAVTGQTWKLPSQAEWNQMFSANGGNEGSYTGLNTAITNAGGTALQGNVSYWSSTENYTGYYANRVSLYNGDASWLNADERNDYRVRACLAF